jgi:hypothetical protein
MRLNQVIAIEKGVKARTTSMVTEIHKACQKPALFNGFSKEYQPKAEDGEMFPPEATRVQQNATDVTRLAGKAWRELFDVTAIKDFGNTEAKADVIVDGVTLVAGAPATYLLFLEKQLIDVRTFVTKLPTLDPSKDWKKDPNDTLFKAEARQTIKTKKVPRSMTLHEGTKEHPPQVQVVAEDVTVGHWSQVDFSGAIPETRQQELLERVEILLKAVKMAREEANGVEVEKIEVGKPVFDWLFAS